MKLAFSIEIFTTFVLPTLYAHECRYNFDKGEREREMEKNNLKIKADKHAKNIRSLKRYSRVRVLFLIAVHDVVVVGFVIYAMGKLFFFFSLSLI